jgi:hypothetical protein
MNTTQIRNNLSRFACAKRGELRQLAIRVAELQDELHTLDAASEALADPKPEQQRPIGTIEIETIQDLFDSMTYSGTTWLAIKGVVGILQSVAREDGSGKNFNVGLLADGVLKTVFISFK